MHIKIKHFFFKVGHFLHCSINYYVMSFDGIQ